MFDLKIFIDTDDDVRLSRRVLKMSRNKNSLTSLQDLLYKYEKQIKPSFEKYIEPTKKFADIILPNYGFIMDENGLSNMYTPSPLVDLIVKKVKSMNTP